MNDGVNILVVDDDEPLLRVIRLALVSEGFGVRTARDGIEALACLDSVQPDLIVLDLQMPRMDGPTFFRKMRTGGCAAPVLILSAYGVEEAMEELGAEGGVSKPFDPAELAQEVSRLLSQANKVSVG